MAKVGADPEQGACQIYGYESVGRAHVLYDDPGYPPGHAKQLLDKDTSVSEVTVIPTAGVTVGSRHYIHYMSVKRWLLAGNWETRRNINRTVERGEGARPQWSHSESSPIYKIFKLHTINRYLYLGFQLDRSNLQRNGREPRKRYMGSDG